MFLHNLIFVLAVGNAQICRWSDRVSDVYLAGHACGVPVASYLTLEEAQDACCQCGSCSGVTYGGGKYSKRIGALLGSDTNEDSWLKDPSSTPTCELGIPNAGYYLSNHACSNPREYPQHIASTLCCHCDECSGITCKTNNRCSIRRDSMLTVSDVGETSYQMARTTEDIVGTYATLRMSLSLIHEGSISDENDFEFEIAEFLGVDAREVEVISVTTTDEVVIEVKVPFNFRYKITEALHANLIGAEYPNLVLFDDIIPVCSSVAYCAAERRTVIDELVYKQFSANDPLYIEGHNPPGIKTAWPFVRELSEFFIEDGVLFVPSTGPWTPRDLIGEYTLIIKPNMNQGFTAAGWEEYELIEDTFVWENNKALFTLNIRVGSVLNDFDLSSLMTVDFEPNESLLINHQYWDIDEQIFIDNFYGPNNQVEDLVQLCGSVQYLCQGENSVYSSVQHCVEFLGLIPNNCNAVVHWTGNVTRCRVLHTYMAAPFPEIHCAHLGPDSPVCKNFDGDFCPPDEAANCGNKIVDSGEDCDDGNVFSGDGCFRCDLET